MRLRSGGLYAIRANADTPGSDADTPFSVTEAGRYSVCSTTAKIPKLPRSLPAAGAAGIGDRLALCGEALIVELSGMIPASGREIAGQRTSAEVEIVAPAHLADQPRRIVDPECQAVIVAKLRVAVARPRRIAVEHGAEHRDLVGQRGLDTNAGHRDRRRRAAGGKVVGLVGRPAERAVDEEIVGLAVEEFDVGGLLSTLMLSALL